MTPFLQDADFTLYVGDVREVLAGLPDESVHCVVTSPPYWGLRDYGTGSWTGGDPDCDHVQSPGAATGNKGAVTTVPYHQTCGKCGATRTDQQFGLEPTPEMYVENMVAVFREVRRVLRRDGTLWLNIGDSYVAGPRGNTKPRTEQGDGAGRFRIPSEEALLARTGNSAKAHVDGLKPKDLVGIPWRLAFALQADGWYLRSEIIWSKPNPMPESVTDRPTKAHEQVFLLTRSPRYFYDADAVREPAEWARWGDQTYSPAAEAMYGQRIKPRSKADLTPRNDGDRWNEANGRGFVPNQSGRNLRSVWEIATQPYPEAHFATYPEALVERCVKAGTSERGACPECGAPWERETERESTQGQERWSGSGRGNGVVAGGGHEGRTGQWQPRIETVGWRPTCACYDSPPRADLHGSYPASCVVLDPFMGSGTTALVARNLGRHSIGVELNESYAELAGRRTRQLSLLTEGAT